MEAPAETWRWVPGFKDLYRVSDQGNVFSVRAGRNLRPGRKPSGHLSIMLGRKHNKDVHVLVLEAFVEKRPLGTVCRHLNGNPADNRLINLVWATYSINGQDKKWHNGQSTYRLSPGEVLAIKEALALGAPRKGLAALYDVSLGTIHAIAQGRFHKDVR